MNVKELIEELETIEDKTLDVRVLLPEYAIEDNENFWVSKVEVSNTGNSGYDIGGEVRLIGSE